MHVTGGTSQLEQTELTATQLDTNVAAGKNVKKKLRPFLQQWLALAYSQARSQSFRGTGSKCQDFRCFTFLHTLKGKIMQV